MNSLFLCGSSSWESYYKQDIQIDANEITIIGTQQTINILEFSIFTTQECAPRIQKNKV